MKLKDLNPRYEEYEGHRHLAFDCPVSAIHKHRIEIPLEGPKAWQLSATTPLAEMFEEPTWDQITIRPSIEHTTHYAVGLDGEPQLCHSHFYITDGEIQIL